MVQINIQHGRLLEPFFQFYHQNCKDPTLITGGWDKWVIPDKEKLKKRIKAYRNVWSEYDKKVIDGISSVLGLSFNREVIDIFIVSGSSRSMSNPLIIGSQHLPDDFIVILSHELVHRILAINESEILTTIQSVISKFAAEENEVVKNHIIIFAVLRKIFEDDIKLLRKVIPNRNNHYKRAYHLTEPYGKILEYFRNRENLK